MLIRHADVRIRAVADLARENHAEHARRVGLEREQLQVEHELRVARRTRPGCRSADPAARRIAVRSLPRRRCAARSRARNPRYSSSLLRSPWPTDARERDWPRRAPSRGCCRLARAREPLGGAAAVAEQPLEHDARMVLGEVRRRLVAPGHGVHVEAVAGVAGALRRRVDGELERAHRRASRRARRPRAGRPSSRA